MDTKSNNLHAYPGNTAEFVVNVLRNAIFKGTLKGNQPLRQDRIAAEYGVSKVPVREALIQLKAEGLVTFMPNRGAVVTVLSPAEVDEIYTMRIALEITALERAMPNLTRADLIRAGSVLEIIDQEEDRSKWGELNWEFHATLYQAAVMPRLLNTIRMLHDNVGRYLVVYLSSPDYRKDSQKEHRDILEACLTQDMNRASEILKRHLTAASVHVMDLLRA